MLKKVMMIKAPMKLSTNIFCKFDSVCIGAHVYGRTHTCIIAGDSASGVEGGSSFISLRPPISPLVPILSNACSLRFSLFSIRAKACRIASIFLSSRVYMNDRKTKERYIESIFQLTVGNPASHLRISRL